MGSNIRFCNFFSWERKLPNSIASIRHCVVDCARFQANNGEVSAAGGSRAIVELFPVVASLNACMILSLVSTNHHRKRFLYFQPPLDWFESPLFWGEFFLCSDLISTLHTEAVGRKENKRKENASNIVLIPYASVRWVFCCLVTFRRSCKGIFLG